MSGGKHDCIACVPTEIVYADGTVKQDCAQVLKERQLTVSAQETVLGELTCTDTDLEEFVLGWLYTRRLIDAPEELRSLRIQGQSAAVELDRPVRPPDARRPLERLTAAPEWTSEDIFALARRFRQEMPLHAETGATHSCYLMRGGAVVYACEDVGRYNAVDKVIGWALRARVPLEECLLYTSGRVPEELVKKLAAARLPVLVSKAIPTAQAVSTARHLGVTLLCRAWEDRYERFA